MSGARVVPGTGLASVATGLPVLDHLLAALAEGGRFDLSLEITPDDPGAEVDAAGAALGEALHDAIAPGAHGEATMPADEALAMVVLERSGRPLVASNADLTGVGGLGSDLPARFLRALAERLELTIHVRLIEGEDTDHVLRAIFRALGLALARAATRPHPTEETPMDKHVIRTDAAPAPFQGAPYNQAIRVGDLVFVAGQLGLAPGSTSIEGDVTAQTEQVLANLAAILEAAGSSLANLVKTTVFLQDLGDFAAMNEVYAKHVGDRPPARSTVEVAKLPSGALVEIEAIAHV